MKKEDIQFLKDLQHEMLTQDHVCQANPRFWVVMQQVKDYWVNDDADGIFIYAKDSAETVFEGEFKELVDWLKELDGVEDCEFDVCDIEFTYQGEEYTIYDIDDLQNFLDEYDNDNYSVGEFRYRDEIVQNTMFLTLRECKEHIERNRHNLKENPHSYAMTASRSPQVERLYKILEETNWEELLKGENNEQK